MTQTFARVDKTKSEKWNRSSTDFERNVIAEELRQKTKQTAELKKEISDVYQEIKEECSPLRFICILKTIVTLRNEQYQHLMSGHTKKISRLLAADTNIDEHIKNISSYRLSFFQKLVLCRGLNFSLPQRISPREILATFEKAYWKLEPKLSSDDKELAAAILRSIALNYSERKGPAPPKAMLRAIGQLKKRDDIVVTKPDKGSGVVVMDKTDYVRLLKESSINDETKFTPVGLERPRTRGRPPKHFHPLLQKEKELSSVVQRILPKAIADSVIQKGSRLAHLYDETIENIAERAVENDWFNKEHNLNITKSDLIELLRVATKNQLFQFEGSLFEQVDGVAMGSPLGPLMANTFMCNIEKQLETRNEMPAFYKRYVDDTLSAMPDVETASEFLITLNNSHPSINFTMELEENGRLPFLGMDIIRNGCHLDMKVYRKPTDTGLLLHYHSHVAVRYKRSLLNTMLNRAFKLSSSWKLFHQECERLKVTFSRLRYPDELVQSTIRQFIESKVSEGAPTQQNDLEKQDPIRIVLPFQDQKSANSVRRQLGDLSRKIKVDISPVYTSRKIKDEIKVREDKPPLVNQQCVVYNFQCNLCDAGYVGYTCRHLHQRIEEHKGSVIGTHLKEQHDMAPDDIAQFFRILKKCQSKFDCLIYEMFFIKELKPTLNKQCDSIRAKLFV
ncbi:hypothetical protein ACROYT_G001201 [Oculina patagonica]